MRRLGGLQSFDGFCWQHSAGESRVVSGRVGLHMSASEAVVASLKRRPARHGGDWDDTRLLEEVSRDDASAGQEARPGHDTESRRVRDGTVASTPLQLVVGRCTRADRLGQGHGQGWTGAGRHQLPPVDAEWSAVRSAAGH